MHSKNKVSNRTQRIVADILTQFFFARNFNEFDAIFKKIYDEYNLCSDPFIHTPCSYEDYCKSILEFEKQAMIDRYGHCDGLE